jgi:DNA repair protein RecO (recombination protein O)
MLHEAAGPATMTTQRRVQQQPAFILHHRPFRDSSQIIELLSRDHGTLAVVARGSRGVKSRLRGVLRPFLPLSVSWILRSDLGTLTGAEAAGAPARLEGDALLSAYYVNELVLRFLHRHDPQPEIFQAYAGVMSALAAAGNVAACLREFEIEFLRQIGYALNLESEAESQCDLDPRRHYRYRIDLGPVAVPRSGGRLVFTGAELASIARREFDRPEILRAANRLLREVIDFHLAGRELNSRKVLVDLHRSRLE